MPHPPTPTQAAAAGGEPDADAAKALAAEIRLLRARRALRTLGLVQDLADLLMVLSEVRLLAWGSGCRVWGCPCTAAPAPPPTAAALHTASTRRIPDGQVRPRKGGLMNHGAVLALAGLVSGCLSAYKNWPGKGPG